MVAAIKCLNWVRQTIYAASVSKCIIRSSKNTQNQAALTLVVAWEEIICDVSEGIIVFYWYSYGN